MSGAVIVFDNSEKRIPLTHQQLCDLIKAAAELRTKNGNRITRTKLLAEYEAKRDMVIPPNDRRKILYESIPILSSAEERLLTDLVETECAGLSLADWTAIVVQTTAIDHHHRRPLPRTWLDILSNHRQWFGEVFETGPQHRLASLAGQYFIVRPTVRRKRAYLVALMTVQADLPETPALFKTESVRSLESTDPAVVDGVMYEAGNFIFCMGKVQENSSFRASILARKFRPGPASEHLPDDLVGIRLGAGRLTELPLAYRIWCARLDTPPPGQDWASWVGVYSDREFRTKFAPHIAEFAALVKWLAAFKAIPLIAPEG